MARQHVHVRKETPALARWQAENRRTIPAPLREAHPVAVNRALALAGHDPRRLTATDERTVLVHNERVW
ncbi:hypothetical protein ABRQ22_14585 [Cellulosimicrobium sp. ES-005]|uniref:Uncharacterized protein n=1 Tax=Cellulosimicrobium sp. ES-005 TaxID=3163031 RepID=A0AAU8FW57_9MICO